jgi:hypothetical protein
MKLPRALAWAALAALAACTSVNSRIRDHQAAFDAYPPGVRETIRRGGVDVGFTKEQTALSLGRPDRTYTRKTADGEREVWAYGVESAQPRVGFGFGLGMGGPVGIGVGVSPDVQEGGANLRVVFENGAVVSVERRGS